MTGYQRFLNEVEKKFQRSHRRDIGERMENFIRLMIKDHHIMV